MRATVALKFFLSFKTSLVLVFCLLLSACATPNAYLIAQAAYAQGAYPKALKFYQKAAEQGDKKAQYNLAVMFYRGVSTPQNFAKALYWFQQSADQGYVKAQYNLGNMFFNGRGADKDIATAVIWFKKASAQGHAKASYSLGYFFHHGEGSIQADLSLAIEYYKLAQGNGQAMYSVGLMYAEGRGVQQDYKKAAYWFEQARFDQVSKHRGYSAAQYYLGNLYSDGLGVEKDLIKAVFAYFSAAKWGNKQATNRLQNYADLNNGDALWALGVLSGEQKKYADALHWHTKAWHQGNARSAVNIAKLYSHGNGVAKDLNKAKIWFARAKHGGYFY